ncbi:conserved hypothetical protein [Burkholderia cenocepacia]|nr:conserved hypothetical protein [Burkholderia cenocepacia]
MNSSMLRIRCSTNVRNDAICEDPALPHLDFFPDCQKWGNQGEGQKLYRYIVFVTKFESSTVHQPAAIEVLAVDNQRATEVHARIYEHRPISSPFGRGSEAET